MSDDATGSADEAPGEDSPAEVQETAYGCPVSDSLGQRVIHPERDAWLDVAASLWADGFNMCIDLTAVDYLTYGGNRALPAGVVAERFEVVASFLSHSKHERIRARIQIPADDPSVGSLYALYPGSDFLEREVFDLFGVTFKGHPDLRRILMPDDYAEGHPLRKDFPLRGRFSRAEQTRRALAQDVERFYLTENLQAGDPQQVERSEVGTIADPGAEALPTPAEAGEDD